ncbi:unnamed protein product [Amoebophrya sp. A25]|nr:unnamed protein product [Amoebophrya sp. A25]|eukprot:GSA25T00016953001.1
MSSLSSSSSLLAASSRRTLAASSARRVLVLLPSQGGQHPPQRRLFHFQSARRRFVAVSTSPSSSMQKLEELTQQIVNASAGASSSSRPSSDGNMLVNIPAQESSRATGSSMIFPRSATSTELAGFVPRAPRVSEKPKKTNFTAKVLFFFFACHALPVAFAIRYYRKRRDERFANTLLALPDTAEAVAMEAARVARSSTNAFLLTAHGMQRIDCAAPEPVRVVPRSSSADYSATDTRTTTTNSTTNEEQDLLASMVPEDVAALFSHVPDPEQQRRPLRQVHFVLESRAQLPEDRRASVFYNSALRHAYATVKGTVSVVEDQELKSYYTYSGPLSLSVGGKKILCKFVPDEVELKTFNQEEQWHSRRLKLEGDDKWCLQMQ